MEHKEFIKGLEEATSRGFIETLTNQFEEFTVDQKIVVFDRIKAALDNQIYDLTGDREVIGFCETCSMPVFDAEKHIYDCEGVVVHNDCPVFC